MKKIITPRINSKELLKRNLELTHIGFNIYEQGFHEGYNFAILTLKKKKNG